MNSNIEKVINSDCDGNLIIDCMNVSYFSGFKGEDSFLFLTKNERYFLTDPRYTEQAEMECPDFKIVNWREYGSKANSIKELCKIHKIKKLGIEKKIMTVDFFEGLKCDEFTTKSIDGKLSYMRSIKSDKEIEYSKKACEISCKVFKEILQDIKVGTTEKELSAKLHYYLKRAGSDARNYENILISGKRTSLLHGIPSDKKLEEGDFVLLDFGAGYNGYLSDMSRTMVLGKASEEQLEFYDVVTKIFQGALGAVKANVTSGEIYEASFNVVKGTKFEKYFYTGIGHGVGLNVHEEPFLSPNSPQLIEENAIITIEPGLYIPNWGGGRIEDQVIVTKDGHINLMKSERKLIELPV